MLNTVGNFSWVNNIGYLHTYSYIYVAHSELSFKDKISTLIHIFLDKSVVSKQYNDSCLVFSFK